jgi:hypothetical protein
MGGEVEVENKNPSRKIRINAHGTDSIACVEILCNGNVIHTATPEPRKAEDKFFLEWEDETPLDRPTFYYIRLRQNDGETAWSSPVWVDLKIKV